jgi:biopolymer transport protein ExbD
MRLPAHDRTGSLEVKMTPMIDVVFLLLIFFVWTSSFETPEFDLPGSLAEVPASGSTENETTPPPVEAFDEIVIRLRQRDGLTVIEMSGRQLETPAALRDRIAEIISLGVQPPVIIDPDPSVTMEWTIKAYDAARSAGADRVLYATDAD